MARRTNASSAAEERNHRSQSAPAAMMSLGVNAGLASNSLSVVGYIDTELLDGEDSVVILDAACTEERAGTLKPIHQREHEGNLATGFAGRHRGLEGRTTFG